MKERKDSSSLRRMEEFLEEDTCSLFFVSHNVRFITNTTINYMRMNGDTKTSANRTTTGSSTKRETNLSTDEIVDVDLTQSTEEEWNSRHSFDECAYYENDGEKQETEGDAYFALQMQKMYDLEQEHEDKMYCSDKRRNSDIIDLCVREEKGRGSWGNKKRSSFGAPCGKEVYESSGEERSGKPDLSSSGKRIKSGVNNERTMFQKIEKVKQTQFAEGNGDKTKCDIKKRRAVFEDNCKNVSDQMELMLKEEGGEESGKSNDGGKEHRNLLVKLIAILVRDEDFDPICCNLESELYDSWHKKLKGEAKIKKHCPETFLMLSWMSKKKIENLNCYIGDKTGIVLFHDFYAFKESNKRVIGKRFGKK